MAILHLIGQPADKLTTFIIQMSVPAGEVRDEERGGVGFLWRGGHCEASWQAANELA